MRLKVKMQHQAGNMKLLFVFYVILLFFFLLLISLQAKGFQPRREDDGAFFLQKVAKLYASKGEKAYNYGQFNSKYFLKENRIYICF